MAEDDELELQDDSLDDEDQELSDDDTTTSTDSEEEDDISAEELAAAAASAHSSLAARNKVRESMQAEIEAFLAKGGQIQKIEDNVMADPPRKPVSNYGSRPI